MGRFGWLHAPHVLRNRVAELHAFAEGVRQDRLRHVVLLGVRGAGLPAAAFTAAFAPRLGCPRVVVLSSFDPDALRDAERRVDFRAALVVVADRRGDAEETGALVERALARLRAADVASPELRLAAITEPGTPLALRAAAEGWRALFEELPGARGGFGALGFGSLVPAALLGLDVDRLLDAAEREADSSRPGGPAPVPPALELGAALGRLAEEGIDKLTLRCSPGLAGFAAWAEALVAQGTGKRGKGIVPVLDERDAPPGAADRVYVDVEVAGEAGSLPAPPPGAPGARFEVDDAYQLGALCFRFELAVAVAGVVLGVDPFATPDAERVGGQPSDDARVALTPRDVRGPRVTAVPAVAAALGVDPGAEGDAGAWLRAHVALTPPGSHVAIVAWGASTPARRALLDRLRSAAARVARAPATVHHGPAHLDATAQMLRGGRADVTIVALLPAPCEPAPGDEPLARLLAEAMAADTAAMERSGRRVLRVELPRPIDESLASLRDALR